MTTRSPPKSLILFIGFERATLVALHNALKDAGHDVVEAETIEEAVALLATDLRPSLAVIDAETPDDPCIEFARRLWETALCPFICLSGSSNADAVNTAATAGALAYLVKPLDIPQILPTVEAALQRSQEMKKMELMRSNLERALAAERSTSVAIGIIVERNRVNRQEAFRMLRDHSRSTRRRINDVAEEIVRNVEKTDRARLALLKTQEIIIK